MSDATFPAEKHVRIPDRWYNDNPGATFLVEPMGRGRATTSDQRSFLVAGILIGGHESDDDATVATVRGFLHAENETDMDDYELALNVVHPLRFKAIHADTDGRRIKFLGE